MQVKILFCMQLMFGLSNLRCPEVLDPKLIRARIFGRVLRPAV
jgi:hypothetical protein